MDKQKKAKKVERRKLKSTLKTLNDELKRLSVRISQMENDKLMMSK